MILWNTDTVDAIVELMQMRPLGNYHVAQMRYDAVYAAIAERFGRESMGAARIRNGLAAR